MFSYNFSSSLIDIEILKEEIKAASLPMPSILFDNDLQRVTLTFVDALTNDQNDSFSSLIAAHSPALERAKRVKKKQIDDKTDELIASGVPFNGEIFSMSLAAQANWMGIVQAYDMGLLTFPYEVSTNSGDQRYTFQTFAEFQQFYGTGMYVLGNHVAGGRALKEQVVLASTLAEVSAIQDNR
jgi:hypothetical protein